MLAARAHFATGRRSSPWRWHGVQYSAAVIVTAAGMSFASIAEASFPGANGAIAAGLDGCEYNPFIRLFSERGEGLGDVTPRGCSTERETYLYDWSPDGQRLLVDRIEASGSVIMTMAPDGTDERALPLPSGAYEASFAPDGHHVVFMLRDSIWTAAIDGSELRKLRPALPCHLRVRDCVSFSSPRWSPNGNLIAFESLLYAFGPGGPPKVGEGVWVMSARTGALKRRIAQWGYEPDWSPDSRRLVYRDGGDIWVVRANGERRRRLIRRPRVEVTSPTWSPDGRSIAWISLRGPDEIGDVAASLWRVRSRGGRPRKLTRLRSPYVAEEGADFMTPNLAWQAVPEP
jgi:Tol biopolymer transport system component